jgi:hypothetical protein
MTLLGAARRDNNNLALHFGCGRSAALVLSNGMRFLIFLGFGSALLLGT